MKCIKKLVALTLAAVLALTMLTACGGGVSNEAAINADMEKTLFTMINAEREARGKKKIEVRLKDAEKAYEETACLMAELSAKTPGVTGEMVNKAGRKAEAVVGNIVVDGKHIQFLHKAISGEFNKENFEKSLKGSNWDWLVKEDYDYLGIISANKGEGNGTILLAITLVNK